MVRLIRLLFVYIIILIGRSLTFLSYYNSYFDNVPFKRVISAVTLASEDEAGDRGTFVLVVKQLLRWTNIF